MNRRVWLRRDVFSKTSFYGANLLDPTAVQRALRAAPWGPKVPPFSLLEALEEANQYQGWEI